MKPDELQTQAWRIAAQTREGDEFCARVLPLLGEGACLLALRLDQASHTLEVEGAAGWLREPVRKQALAGAEWRALLDLAEASRGWAGPSSALPGPLPGLAQGEHLALAGLRQGDEPIGLLLVGAATESAEALAQALRGPCETVLANQQSWRALSTEREAAEAERRALLLRLKRPGVADAIVGAEAGLSEVMEAVRQVAPADAPVLILGETGTGKEVVARAVHEHSRRAKGPFLRVNCGAIPSELIDSELFGHERGSFTGAVGVRKGWFERADGGTLFLDEIGELPLAAQVRLLRVLQDGSFQRVGGERSLSVDVRLVAATNRDLRGAVREGLFREDLWFRVAVFPIPLPPLRERLQDIPALAAHFCLRAAERLGLPPRMPEGADLDLLRAYPWPGNVRELASVIERAAILGNGRRLEMARALGGHPMAETGGAETNVVATGNTILSLEEATRRHIEAALARCHGRVDGPFGAARQLQLNPNTLRSKMRKLGMTSRGLRGND